MIKIPFFNSVTIVGVRVLAVANAILTIEGSVKATPADLHKAIREKRHLVVEAVTEYGRVRTYRNEA